MLLPLVGCAACGSLAGPDFRGEPLFTLSGTLRGTILEKPVAPHLGTLMGRLSVQPDVAGEVVRITATGFPAEFRLELHAPPPQPALQKFADGAEGAFGVVVAVDDVNGDGTFALEGDRAAAPDRFFGFGWGALLVWLSAPTAADGIVENPARARAGYQLGRFVCGQLRLRLLEGSLPLEVSLEPEGRISYSDAMSACVQ